MNVRVLIAERLDGDVIVTFEDGRCALYSAALLHATFEQARNLNAVHYEGDDLALEQTDGLDKQES